MVRYQAALHSDKTVIYEQQPDANTKRVVSAFDTGQPHAGITQQFKGAKLALSSLLRHSISRKTFLL